jgi:Holliday junction resolvase RusA-like endonuclease
VRLELDVVVARPQSLRRRKDPRGRMWCATKPDADNAAKLMMDAIVKAGVLTDDTRVVELVVRKWYAAIEPVEQPHTDVQVWSAT